MESSFSFELAPPWQLLLAGIGDAMYFWLIGAVQGNTMLVVSPSVLALSSLITRLPVCSGQVLTLASGLALLRVLWLSDNRLYLYMLTKMGKKNGRDQMNHFKGSARCTT